MKYLAPFLWSVAAGLMIAAVVLDGFFEFRLRVLVGVGAVVAGVGWLGCWAERVSTRGLDVPMPPYAVVTDVRALVYKHSFTEVFLALRWLAWERSRNGSLRSAYPGVTWRLERFVRRTGKDAAHMRLYPKTW